MTDNLHTDTDRPLVSILMPVYNEEVRVAEALSRIEEAKLAVDYEVIVVDDGSVDRSIEIVAESASLDPRIKPFPRAANGGKGRAIADALRHATGEFAVIYDADLEYDPVDLIDVLAPLIEGQTEVVYGVRAFGGHSAHSFWYVVGNRVLTLSANVIFNSYIRDMMTCYKAMPLELFRSLAIESNGFELEAEITGKLMKQGHRIYEVPISYTARSHEEGKKIRPFDSVRVLTTLAKLRMKRR